MASRPSLWKLVAIAVALIAAGAAGLWWFKIHDFSIGRSIDAALDVLRSAGPVPFFLAMAVLPAVGAPISLFYLAAGSAFTPQLGLGGVLAASGAALVVDIALGYWLACYAIRPWLEDLISRTKYRIPQLDAADHTELTLIVRITPGPPFFLQSFLLGLAGVRFRKYMWVSWTVQMAMGTGMIIFGDALLHGKGQLAFYGVSLIVVAALGIRFLRRYYGKKRS